MQQDRLLKVRDAAKAYDCSPDTIRKLIKSGDLPAVQVGSTWRIRESDLDAYAAPATVTKARVAAAAEQAVTDLRERLDRDLNQLRQELRELRHEVYPRSAV